MHATRHEAQSKQMGQVPELLTCFAQLHVHGLGFHRHLLAALARSLQPSLCRCELQLQLSLYHSISAAALLHLLQGLPQLIHSLNRQDVPACQVADPALQKLHMGCEESRDGKWNVSSKDVHQPIKQSETAGLNAAVLAAACLLEVAPAVDPLLDPSPESCCLAAPAAAQQAPAPPQAPALQAAASAPAPALL